VKFLTCYVTLCVNCLKELGREPAVPLTNSIRLADQLRMEYCLHQSAESTSTDSCPFRFGSFSSCVFV